MSGPIAAAPQARGYLRRLVQRPLAALALAWIALLVVVALTAPFLPTLDPLDQDLLAVKQWPNLAHWLGTDALGRDVFSRIVHGLPMTVAGVLEAVFVAALLGLGLGVGHRHRRLGQVSDHARQIDGGVAGRDGHRLGDRRIGLGEGADHGAGLGVRVPAARVGCAGLCAEEGRGVSRAR